MNLRDLKELKQLLANILVIDSLFIHFSNLKSREDLLLFFVSGDKLNIFCFVWPTVQNPDI